VTSSHSMYIYLLPKTKDRKRTHPQIYSICYMVVNYSMLACTYTCVGLHLFPQGSSVFAHGGTFHCSRRGALIISSIPLHFNSSLVLCRKSSRLQRSTDHEEMHTGTKLQHAFSPPTSKHIMCDWQGSQSLSLSRSLALSLCVCVCACDMLPRCLVMALSRCSG